MDKLYHFGAGIIIALAVSFAAYYGGLTGLRPEGYGLAAAILIGIFKEVYDLVSAYRDKVEKPLKYFDGFDLLATCAGGFAGIFILIVGFKL